MKLLMDCCIRYKLLLKNQHRGKMGIITFLLTLNMQGLIKISIIQNQGMLKARIPDLLPGIVLKRDLMIH